MPHATRAVPLAIVLLLCLGIVSVVEAQYPRTTGAAALRRVSTSFDVPTSAASEHTGRLRTLRFVAAGAAIGAVLGVSICVISLNAHPPGSEDLTRSETVNACGIAGVALGALTGLMVSELTRSTSDP